MKRLSFCLVSAALAATLAAAPGTSLAAGYGHGAGEPEFLFSIGGTGAYYLPGVQADVFFHLGNWYRRAPGGWMVSATLSGPWGFISLGSVPQVLVRLPVDYRIRHRVVRVPYRLVVPVPPRALRRPYYYRPKYDDRRWHPRNQRWERRDRRHWNQGPPAWSAGHRHRPHGDRNGGWDDDGRRRRGRDRD